MINEKLVCIVDDDLEVRDSLSLMLGLKGFDCRTYSSGTAFLSAPPSRPCCLVLDLKMGEMDGLSLQEKIIERHLPVEIIFLTAFADVDVMRTAFLNSAVDFLEKPVLIDQILNALEKAYSRLKLKEDSRQVETLHESLTPVKKRSFESLHKASLIVKLASYLGSVQERLKCTKVASWRS